MKFRINLISIVIRTRTNLTTTPKKKKNQPVLIRSLKFSPFGKCAFEDNNDFFCLPLWPPFYPNWMQKVQTISLIVHLFRKKSLRLVLLKTHLRSVLATVNFLRTPAQPLDFNTVYLIAFSYVTSGVGQRILIHSTSFAILNISSLPSVSQDIFFIFIHFALYQFLRLRTWGKQRICV